MAVVLTKSGMLLDLDYPILQNEELDPRIIGPSLHRIPRFNGHLCFDYSVLQHSLFCALYFIQKDSARRSYGDIYARPSITRAQDMAFYLATMVEDYFNNQFECNEGRTRLKVAFTLYRCLYHDATEVYISDVPHPIKAQYTSLDEVEDRLADMIDTSWLDIVDNAKVGASYPDNKSYAEPVVRELDYTAMEAERYLGLPNNPGWITDRPGADACRLVHWLAGMPDERLYWLFQRLYELTVGIAKDTKVAPIHVVSEGSNDA